jgi:hypothetical protein
MVDMVDAAVLWVVDTPFHQSFGRDESACLEDID